MSYSDLLKRRKQEIHTALVEARGAWGIGKSLEEIDREISARREADWPGDETVKQRVQMNP